MLYKGLSLYHRGRVKVNQRSIMVQYVGHECISYDVSESFSSLYVYDWNSPILSIVKISVLSFQESIEIFKVVLQTNTNQAECHRSLGHAYRYTMDKRCS